MNIRVPALTGNGSWEYVYCPKCGTKYTLHCNCGGLDEPIKCCGYEFSLQTTGYELVITAPSANGTHKQRHCNDRCYRPDLGGKETE